MQVCRGCDDKITAGELAVMAPKAGIAAAWHPALSATTHGQPRDHGDRPGAPRAARASGTRPASCARPAASCSSTCATASRTDTSTASVTTPSSSSHAARPATRYTVAPCLSVPAETGRLSEPVCIMKAYSFTYYGCFLHGGCMKN